MKNTVIIIFFFILLSGILSGCANSTEGKTYYFDEDGNMSTTKPEPKAADKVQVFLFHATNRCSSCIAIGKLADETVNERFADELKTGKIEFREINIDLPENKELARKFRASGSSLFLNAIYNNQDHIEQNTMVWRLINNPDRYKDYLSGEINKLFGR